MKSELSKDDQLQEIGKNAYAAICEMVEALQCDYERLEELREERGDWDAEEEGSDWQTANADDAEELSELEAAAGDCESEDDARQRIDEDPLSIQLRSGWYSIGEEPEPEEFEILLSTGGPAVRIIGELSSSREPDRARLQVQDWGTPWTDYREADSDIIEAYCSCFYFGE